MEWTNIKDAFPAREVDILFIDTDDTMYVGKRCNWENCNDFHYNSTSQDPNGIKVKDIKCWMYAPVKPSQTKVDSTGIEKGFSNEPAIMNITAQLYDSIMECVNSLVSAKVEIPIEEFMKNANDSGESVVLYKYKVLSEYIERTQKTVHEIKKLLTFPGG